MDAHKQAQLDTLANVCAKAQYAYHVALMTPAAPHVIVATANELIAAWAAYDAVADA